MQSGVNVCLIVLYHVYMKGKPQNPFENAGFCDMMKLV